MDAIEKRARELLDTELRKLGLHENAHHVGCGAELDRNDQAAINAIAAALTPPEGYVLVPVEVQKDADRFRFLASWAGAEFNSERGYLRWYLSRKGRGFATLAETVDQCLPAARPEVP